jgi:hypothetical protein
MRTFTLQQSKTEIYTPHGRLTLVGHCLNQHTSLIKTTRTTDTYSLLKVADSYA